MGARTLIPFCMALVLSAGPLPALELRLPGSARLTGEVLRAPDSYLLPVAPYADGALPVVELEGRVLQQAWQIDQQGMTTLQMIRPLRDQLSAAGYDIILDCGGRECGGFDFRFSTRVLPAPDMYVDLNDFRFLAARRPGADGIDSASYASVIVSQAGSVGYVQVIQVTPDGGESPLPVTPAATTPTAGAPSGPEPGANGPVVETLTELGHVILKDLDFGTGASALGEGPHRSLEALAAYLLADETRRVALVGHTDSVGSTRNNKALSRARATAVLERLVSVHGVPRAQLEADGVGSLSPIAPNRTPEGREANRRVEAVLLSGN